MTEKTLERANEIKKGLDSGREILREFEELRAMCYGNEAELEKRKFYVEIKDNMCGKRARVTLEAARVAFNKVIEEISEEIRELKSKLDELH